jgi:hypothetical protein
VKSGKEGKGKDKYVKERRKVVLNNNGGEYIPLPN